MAKHFGIRFATGDESNLWLVALCCGLGIVPQRHFEARCSRLTRVASIRLCLC